MSIKAKNPDAKKNRLGLYRESWLRKRKSKTIASPAKGPIKEQHQPNTIAKKKTATVHGLSGKATKQIALGIKKFYGVVCGYVGMYMYMYMYM